ncbi:hypothetical protein POM88_027137 [Heracleum sosnowskyi]|uniref:Uncharacterized protein n=1 Tax=Heracleum sosnowskyi TaxID=360622 RepID=A0AAD8I7W9_9APIA|nr:hypothetical protein POM88_027137 [Heracleum sosnowskyi]
MGFCTEENSGLYDKTYWHSDYEIAHAVWTHVHICSLDDAYSFGDLVSDFISKVLQGHSKGVNLELVQNSLLELERKFEGSPQPQLPFTVPEKHRYIPISNFDGIYTSSGGY